MPATTSMQCKGNKGEEINHLFSNVSKETMACLAAIDEKEIAFTKVRSPFLLQRMLARFVHRTWNFAGSGLGRSASAERAEQKERTAEGCFMAQTVPFDFFIGAKKWRARGILRLLFS